MISNTKNFAPAARYRDDFFAKIGSPNNSNVIIQFSYDLILFSSETFKKYPPLKPRSQISGHIWLAGPFDVTNMRGGGRSRGQVAGGENFALLKEFLRGEWFKMPQKIAPAARSRGDNCDVYLARRRRNFFSILKGVYKGGMVSKTKIFAPAARYRGDFVAQIGQKSEEILTPRD